LSTNPAEAIVAVKLISAGCEETTARFVIDSICPLEAKGTLLYNETAARVDMEAIDKLCELFGVEVEDLFERIPAQATPKSV
jgi:DNA-binding Xre family transcriptional regulator